MNTTAKLQPAVEDMLRQAGHMARVAFYTE